MARFIKSLSCALNGVKLALGQRNIKIMLFVGIAAVASGVIRDIGTLRMAIVVVCAAVVLAAECFNTAIEHLCDTLHPGYSEGIGKVKDIAAAAVLVCSLGAAIVGMLVFIF